MMSRNAIYFNYINSEIYISGYTIYVDNIKWFRLLLTYTKKGVVVSVTAKNLTSCFLLSYIPSNS
jgi:hypothetical protein